ncbi:MAG: pyridoxal-phosphate dependent enzyme [Dehalococcoidia bacterium]|nr:pyridoxal-phosphate dependent enzyme [Dehalococcoidia bacterium]
MIDDNEIKRARQVLRAEPWLPTPLLPSAVAGQRLGIDLWFKREDCTPVGSFKIRGGLVSMALADGTAADRGVYGASAGNYGLALAEAGRRRGVRVTIVVPIGANPSKVQRILATGASVIHHGDDFDAAKEHARSTAKEVGAAFWEDGVIPEMALGAATIAAELIESEMNWDWVLVPVGNGSLIKGIAWMFRSMSPDTKVIGLVSTGAPAMAMAISGEPFDPTALTSTEADGLDVRVPIVPISREIGDLVAGVWLVPEQSLIPAVRSMIDLEQTMVEPSAAITLAACHSHREDLKGARVAAIVTGAHLRSSLLEAVSRSPGLPI